jgi:hypothetical protein
MKNAYRNNILQMLHVSSKKFLDIRKLSKNGVLWIGVPILESDKIFRLLVL